MSELFLDVDRLLGDIGAGWLTPAPACRQFFGRKRSGPVADEGAHHGGSSRNPIADVIGANRGGDKCDHSLSGQHEVQGGGLDVRVGVDLDR